MKPLFSLYFAPTPPRFTLKRRGVVFWLLLGAIGEILPGCSFAPPASIFPAPTPLPAAQKRAQEAARYHSVGAALAKIDAKTVRAWVDRWSAPGTLSAQNRAHAVRIDAEALAHRHPAWILADDLENGAISPLAPRIASILAVPIPHFSLALAGQTGASRILPAQTVISGGSDASKIRQNAALDRFFASAAARDALRERDQAFLARRALEDSIAAQQRGALSELDLTLVPPDVALELTNLRLQLVRNLAKTTAQRAAARAEIEAIEARYDQIWRDQTARQAARLREISKDLPARKRREGLERIAREGASEAQTRAAARRDETRSAAAQLNRDFILKNADLHLALPPARSISALGFTSRSGSGANAEFLKTNLGARSSVAPDEKGVLSAPHAFDPRLIATLRAQARLEARHDAALVAAQWGSRWDNAPTNPDRTAAAMAILFPGR